MLLQALCVAWEDGDIQVWNDQEKESFDAPRLHQSAVTGLVWSSSGTRLLSADSVCFFLLF